MENPKKTDKTRHYQVKMDENSVKHQVKPGKTWLQFGKTTKTNLVQTR